MFVFVVLDIFGFGFDCGYYYCVGVIGVGGIYDFVFMVEYEVD